MRHRKVNSHLTAKFFLLASCLALVVTAGSLPPGAAQSARERRLDVSTFNRMPLKVKEVRNLQKAEDWFRDLEIEVENVSDKPIYFISLILEFPNIPAPPPETRPDGTTPERSTTGFRMTYGASRLIDVNKLAAADDVFLKPGETYIFKVPDSRVLGLEHMKREKNLPPEATDKIDIEFDIINFGDGTGYIGGEKRIVTPDKRVATNFSERTATTLTGTVQSGQERTLKVLTFNRTPLKVKQIRNLQTEDWFRDLEIEVENVSDKPIYYIDVVIEFPHITAPPPVPRADGTTPSRATTGFWLSFGPPRLGDVQKLAAPEDTALKPGESYVFKIPEHWVKGFESMKQRNYFPPEAANKLELEFTTISFGDGTGYVVGERRAYPKRKQ